VVRIANIVVSGTDEGAVAVCAESVTKWLTAANERFDLGIFVLGPAPSPLERIKSRWRWHVVLKAEQPAKLTRLLRGFLDGFDVPAAHDMRVIADRDPVSLL
jgi:primosomal protein N' (replication factor Y)